MKVLLVNGSPRKNGCTNAALNEIAGTLAEEGVESEIFWVGAKPVRTIARRRMTIFLKSFDKRKVG
ncbi:MAG TPA: NAD(P)H-dependent oxidoreductase [Candidatus Limadaptatus stercoravium]|nr:NAD(P)H-dependent oxidoreductase [Candidatus Limadaptatus stercoravium]